MHPFDLVQLSDILTNQLQIIATSRGAIFYYGKKHILFEKIIIDVFDFFNTKSDNQLILDQISVWKDTDKSGWILDNIANIIVSGVYNAPTSQIYLHIYANVDDYIATEYWLRWSE
jgi:hypothetical protein